MMISKSATAFRVYWLFRWARVFNAGPSRSCGHTLPPQTCMSRIHSLSEMTVKNFNQIPGPRGLARLPVIGAAFLFKPFTDNIMSRPDLMAIDLHKRYGDIVRLTLPFGPTVFLKSPKDMMAVIENEGRAPERPKFPLILAYLKSRNVKTLATLEGEDWRRLRMKVQPTFLRPGSADPYFPAISEVADDFVSYLQNHGGHDTRDFRDLVFLYILECLYQFCFQRRLGSVSASCIEANNVTAKKVKELINELTNIPFLPLYKIWRTRKYKTIESSMDHLLQISSIEVRRVVQSLQGRDTKNHDTSCPLFIETLLAKSGMSEDEAVTTMSDFFFGGSDTTSKNLSMVFYHLAKHPEQQELLYQEIASVIGEDQVTCDHIDRLGFLKACVKESMRLRFPLAPGPCRRLQQDLVLSGYNVPKGTWVTLCNVAYLHDPEYVKNPEVYCPERWLRDKDRTKRETIPTVCFLPFGIGLRMCLGKRFSDLIMYICLIKVIQKYELKLKDESLGADIVYEIFPTINKPLKIDFFPRFNT